MHMNLICDMLKAQCLKLMVAHSPLVTKIWTGPVRFDPGQVKIIIDFIRKEIFLTFLGDKEKIIVWNTESVVPFASPT